MKATRWRRRAASTPSAIAQVGLAGADRSGDHDILCPLQVLTGRELSELRALDASERLPVELFEGLEVGESRLAEQARHRAIAAGQHLGLKKLREKLLIVPAVPSCQHHLCRI